MVPGTVIPGPHGSDNKRTNIMSRTSELPPVWISYDHHVDDDIVTEAYEGRYVPEDLLPFDVSECAGVEFRMDGITFEIVGDLSGHGIYRRSSDPSTCYAMTWEEISRKITENEIEIL